MSYSEKNTLCLIITAFNPDGIPDFVLRQADDALIICADGGYVHARNAHLQPQYIIGDFDSSPLPGAESDSAEIIRLPKEKDDTDTMACAKKGLELGNRRFLIACGAGGRPDHAFANLQVLSYLSSHGAKAVLADSKTLIQIASPGKLTLHRKRGFHFSLFSYSERCAGVTLSGAKYPLKNAVLEQTFPLGVSNEFAEETVTVSHSEGLLLVMVTADDNADTFPDCFS